MGVHFELDISDIEPEFRRLGVNGNIDHKLIFALEAVFTTVFQTTQKDVHVQTGSLKGSGKPKSSYSKLAWTGTIVYGGTAGGHVHDPVKYAEYEARRGAKSTTVPRKDGKPRRPGNHDFLHSARKMDELYGKVLGEWIKKG